MESPRDGKYIELLGWYDPHSEQNYQLKSERIFYWLNQGAELTEKAGALVKQGAPGVYAELMAKKLLVEQSLDKRDELIVSVLLQERLKQLLSR